MERLPMPPYRPRTQLATHEVTNQPPPLEGYSLFETNSRLGGERSQVYGVLPEGTPAREIIARNWPAAG